MGFLHSKRTATGRAQIVKAQILLQESHGSGFEWQNPISAVASSVHLRVTPDNGGPEFDSATHAMGGDESHLMEGHWTYVLYDPEQSGHCDIDRDRLMTEFGRVDGKKRTTIPQWWAEERFEGVVPREPTVIVPGELSASQERSDAASAPVPAEAMVSDLKDLAKLHASGALTDAEYAAAKSRLLAGGQQEGS